MRIVFRPSYHIEPTTDTTTAPTGTGQGQNRGLMVGWLCSRSLDLRAFTLIELLVTITTIFILASLLFAVVRKTQHKAYAVKCVSNIKQVGNMLLIYTGENDQTYPNQRWGANGLYLDPASFAAYLDPKAEAWHCPSVKLVRKDGRYYYNWRLTHQPNWRGENKVKPVSVVSPASAMLLADLDTASRGEGGDHNYMANVFYADGHVAPHVDLGIKDYSLVTQAADPGQTVNAEYIGLHNGKLKGFDY